MMEGPVVHPAGKSDEEIKVHSGHLLGRPAPCTGCRPLSCCERGVAPVPSVRVSTRGTGVMSSSAHPLGQ